jgi:hypothetical protein
MLDSEEVSRLKNAIRDTFRIRANHSPAYVDIGGNLIRFGSQQHQVIFGRRGSGKSCLQVHFLRASQNDREVTAVYVGVDEIKRLGYPDILIRLLLAIFEELPGSKISLFGIYKTKLRRVIDDLRKLLDQPEASQVNVTEKTEKSAGASLRHPVAGASAASKVARETMRAFGSKKLDDLERHLADYKKVLKAAVGTPSSRAYILVDDFYLIERDRQPFVIDYLHRLLRDTNAYLKLATIRHRTTLRTHEGQTVGVELSQDVEELSLDKTFQSFSETHEYLHSMLSGMAAEELGGGSVSSLFGADAARALTLASGGVPRDFLNIFVEAIDVSLRHGVKARLTPKYIYKAASALSYRSKIANLKEEAGFDSSALEALFADLVRFCLIDKKKTLFLVNHAEVQSHARESELLQQLMDFKLIHLVDSNTSAASGRSGRFAAYTLDFSIFMEPRKRNIDIVEFWSVDDQRRPVGIREAPDYSLSRAAAILASPQTEAVDSILDAVPLEESGGDPDAA